MNGADVFTEVAWLLLLATACGAVGLWLRQPLIVSFIAAGILAGPSVLGLVAANDQVSLLAGLGISLLLFVVGLKLDVHIIRTFGPVALATGLGQVVFTSLIGFVLARLLGLGTIPAIYVAVALTFSSTIIIVKLLSDKKEADTLHGRIAIGFLIVQDIVVVLVMIGLTALATPEAGAGPAPATQALVILLKGVALLAGVFGLMRWVLTPALRRLSRSRELLVLSAVAWAVALSAAAHHLGFSKEVGAFLAGVSLASTPYREVIGSRLVSLRDFLLLFFFIDLGGHLDLGSMAGQIAPSLVLSVFVLIGNPLIVMVIMGAMGYRKRTSFLAGLTVAQISEFSLILGALGLRLGHVDAGVMGIITLVGLITISLSTYMILHSGTLYRWMADALTVFERRDAGTRTPALAVPNGGSPPEVIVFGLGRYGLALLHALRSRNLRVLGVDCDPDLLHRQAREGLPVLFGDAEDPGFLETLPLADAQWVVNSIRDRHLNHVLLHNLREHGFHGRTAVTAVSSAEASALRDLGAALALTPFADAATEAVDRMMATAALSEGTGETPPGPSSS